MFEIRMAEREKALKDKPEANKSLELEEVEEKKKINISDLKPLKLIRKIWEK